METLSSVCAVPFDYAVREIVFEEYTQIGLRSLVCYLGSAHYIQNHLDSYIECTDNRKGLTTYLIPANKEILASGYSFKKN